MSKHWLIVGASGGIGKALVNCLMAQGDKVSAISRQPSSFLSQRHQALSWYQLASAEQPEALEILTTIFSSKIDAVVLCQGWLHGDGMQPEKSIRQLSRAAMQQSLEVNLMQPACYLQQLLPLLQKQQNVKVAVLSAKVGSITDNQLGGWYSYRMAKAALNMLVKCSSIELARYNKEATLISLHPGTTDSELSAPFQKNLPMGQLRTAEETASRLIEVIMALTPERTGALVNWDGSVLPY
ncbi:SDR family oxidoreductase [Alishewanella longhuensis]|uniref:SDR family oxidoreductase n=1 Tax=Alishewanella longhuensis TaxID=1091037 RepID=A0ABQ3KVE6_9ALTE|nr:SDR family NAD(P)-dependent oxidoreductase [Alishewanella longhuensis]GHG63927.1 SDR family oxidoreductase [Alishewanella longhuensis]